MDPNAPLSDLPVWEQRVVAECNRPGARVLEIGSRQVVGLGWRHAFGQATYVGFDYYPGPNVDITGDVHRLSSCFAGQEQFDAVLCYATFEHFAMPWIAATEIAKVLKVGGYVLVNTHFSIGLHERPWHFFQFSDMALRVLFPPALGFECLGAGFANPMVGRFSEFAHPELRRQPIPGLYFHVSYFGRKVRDVLDFAWDRVDVAALVGGTQYPAPRAAASRCPIEGSCIDAMGCDGNGRAWPQRHQDKARAEESISPPLVGLVRVAAA
ncbi:MAG TPA: methyltransferase domain-containing protein [Acetobacteraceae bacterium]|nr:methyltransferase domain-containing protein [Acetobacteraceae bacterium]